MQSRDAETASPSSPRRNLSALVRSFSLTERHVLMLHYAEGLTTQEIMQVLDLPELQIERVLRRIQRRTRQCLGLDVPDAEPQPS